jgi:hypothetical protein
MGNIPIAHFSFKALILQVQSTCEISALFPIFASGAGVARATRKNGMLPSQVIILRECCTLRGTLAK